LVSSSKSEAGLEATIIQSVSILNRRCGLCLANRARLYITSFCRGDEL